MMSAGCELRAALLRNWANKGKPPASTVLFADAR